MRFHLLMAVMLVAAPQAIAAPPTMLVSAPPARNEECNGRWNALSAEDKTKLNYANFTQTCENDLSPNPLPVSTAAQPLADVTGMCRDATYTENRNRKNACTRHGGIQLWFAGIR